MLRCSALRRLNESNTSLSSMAAPSWVCIHCCTVMQCWQSKARQKWQRNSLLLLAPTKILSKPLLPQAMDSMKSCPGEGLTMKSSSVSRSTCEGMCSSRASSGRISMALSSEWLCSTSAALLCRQRWPASSHAAKTLGTFRHQGRGAPQSVHASYSKRLSWGIQRGYLLLGSQLMTYPPVCAGQRPCSCKGRSNAARCRGGSWG